MREMARNFKICKAVYHLSYIALEPIEPAGKHFANNLPIERGLANRVSHRSSIGMTERDEVITP